MIDKIKKEKEDWEKYYNNYESLEDSVFATILAHIKPEERLNKFNHVVEILNGLKEPISDEVFINSLESDIQSFKNINKESEIALRTLTWVEEELEKDTK
jgi:hypothetical protein